MIFFLCYAFLTALNLRILLASFCHDTYILGDVIDIKSNAYDSGISLIKGANVRLLYHMVIEHFVSKALVLGYKHS